MSMCEPDGLVGAFETCDPDVIVWGRLTARSAARRVDRRRPCPGPYDRRRDARSAVESGPDRSRPQMASLEDALGRAEGGSRRRRARRRRGRDRQEPARRGARGSYATAWRLVLEGGCVSIGSEEGLPFAPIAEALRGLLRVRPIADRRRGHRSRYPRARAPRPGAPHGRRPGRLAATPVDWAQTRLFEAFLTLLERLGSDDRSCWSSRTSIGRIARRAISWHSSPGDSRTNACSSSATYRSDELHRRHPSDRGSPRWSACRTSSGSSSPRFDADEVADLVAAIRAAPRRRPCPRSPTGDRRATRSSPRSCWPRIGRPTVLPARLRDVLLGRIGSLSDDGQAASSPRRRSPAVRSITTCSGACSAMDDEGLAHAHSRRRSRPAPRPPTARRRQLRVPPRPARGGVSRTSSSPRSGASPRRVRRSTRGTADTGGRGRREPSRGARDRGGGGDVAAGPACVDRGRARHRRHRATSRPPAPTSAPWPCGTSSPTADRPSRRGPCRAVVRDLGRLPDRD